LRSILQHRKRIDRIRFIGVFVWLIGFIFETGGDIQLARLKLTRQTREKCLIRVSGIIRAIQTILVMQPSGVVMQSFAHQPAAIFRFWARFNDRFNY